MSAINPEDSGDSPESTGGGCDGLFAEARERFGRLAPLHLARRPAAAPDPHELAHPCGLFARCLDYTRHFVRGNPRRDAIHRAVWLAHGTVRGLARFVWVELPDPCIYEPVTRGLYARFEFEAILQPTPWVYFAPRAAEQLAQRSGHPGPWYGELGLTEPPVVPRRITVRDFRSR